MKMDKIIRLGTFHFRKSQTGYIGRWQRISVKWLNEMTYVKLFYSPQGT